MEVLLLRASPRTGRQNAQNPAGSRVLCVCSGPSLYLNQYLQHAASIKRTGYMGRIRRGGVERMTEVMGMDCLMGMIDLGR